MSFDPGALRDSFHRARAEACRGARWGADDPGALPGTCRYCGKWWRRWPGSQLDGHAACLVPDYFKSELLELLRPADVTFQRVASALGVSIAVVRSWTFPIRVGT